MLWQVSHGLAAELLHHLTELSLEDGDGVCASLLPQRSHAIHERSAQEGKLSSRGQGAGDVRPRADPAVHHDADLVFEFWCDVLQGLDGRLSMIQLTAAMVGYDDSVQA